MLGSSARKVIAKTVWRRARHDAGKWGSRILRETLGEVSFDYVKSPYAVLDCLASAVAHKKDALILDFFAGSGTTLLATLLLNERDTGNRRCILVTNNEVSTESAAALTIAGAKQSDAEWEIKGVCQSVTWPRAKNTILGYSENGEKLSGTYIDQQIVEKEVPREIVQLSFAEGADLSPPSRKDLLKILEGFTASSLNEKDYAVTKDKRRAVVFADVEKFIEQLEHMPDLETVYAVTKDKKVFRLLQESIHEELGPLVLSVPKVIPMDRGFRAGVDYFKLGFLDPGAVSAGQAYAAILPILWMMAGCIGPCPSHKGSSQKWVIEENSRFAVLIQERSFNAFLKQISLNIAEGIESPIFIFLVTDEDDSFIIWRRQLLELPWDRVRSNGVMPEVVQLYRNYLDNFRIRVNTNGRSD